MQAPPLALLACMTLVLASDSSVGDGEWCWCRVRIRFNHHALPVCRNVEIGCVDRKEECRK